MSPGPKAPPPPPPARPRAPHVAAALAATAQPSRPSPPAGAARPVAAHVQQALARPAPPVRLPAPQPPALPAASVQRLPAPGLPPLPPPHVQGALRTARGVPPPAGRSPLAPGRVAAPPVPRPQRPGTIQRMEVEEETREYYFTSDKKEFKNEIDLLGWKVDRLTPANYRKKTPKLEKGAVLHIQHHGQYIGGSTRAANTIVLSTGAIDPETFAANLTLPQDRTFVLDIVSCFTAGTREEWESKYHPANIGRTFSYRLAQRLHELGYPDGIVVRGYVGQSKVLSGTPTLVIGAGARVGESRMDASEEGWYVDFTVGDPVIVNPGPALGRFG